MAGRDRGPAPPALPPPCPAWYPPRRADVRGFHRSARRALGV